MESINQNIKKEQVWKIMENVYDPEIPVLSVVDLGIIRDIRVNDNSIEVFITPTYSGCPAMDLISMDIKIELLSHGYKNIKLTRILSPAWTTDWMSEQGKEKLKNFGIAPPGIKSTDKINWQKLKVECPHCESVNTNLISEFGSTSCKALYVCDDCKEPFDYFKCH